MKDLEYKLKRVPQKPGVYLFKNQDSKILYVGKAKNIRSRLRTHFNSGSDRDLRHKKLMSKVADFEYIITDTETEALILEANLIKEYKPRYNVNLKDDKTYPYIRVTTEFFPRVFITRKIVKDGSLYFGPYTDVKSVRKLMTAVQRIFPLRTCSRVINNETISKHKHRACLNYQIGKCMGPCEGKISREDYLRNLDQVVKFIKGKNSVLINELKSKMSRCAEQMKFEEAARLRDEIRAIERFTSHQKVVDSINSNRDIITIASEKSISCCVVFIVREGRIINRLHFYLENRENHPDSEVMATFIKQYYLTNDFIPDEILLPFELEEKIEIEKWLTHKKSSRVRINIPVRGKKSRLIGMCTRNAELLLKEILIQKETIQNQPSKSVQILQKDLNLKKPPVRIEAFDISNIQGTDSVASLVVFENGKPKKSQYRKYKIKTVDGPDDFRSMAEVVERRILRLKKENKPMPDLFLIDGGKGQLSAVFEVLKRMELEHQPVIGLAKKLEDVFVPNNPDPQNISKSSPGLYLLRQIRDESHRFAVTFHRQKRKKRTLHSVLDDIPGIGEKRRNKLLKAFGSVKEIQKASVSELEAVVGVKSAREIFKVIKK